MAIRYCDSDIEVRLGDHVEIKVWFRKRSGRVVYVPGLSPLNTQFEYNGMRWVAIRTERMIIGTVVKYQTETLKPKVKFIRRDGGSFEEAPDDPQYYEENGGGWSP